MNMIIKNISICVIIFLVVTPINATTLIFLDQIDDQDYVNLIDQNDIIILIAQTHQNLPPELRERMNRMANGGNGGSSLFGLRKFGIVLLIAIVGIVISIVINSMKKKDGD